MKITFFVLFLLVASKQQVGADVVEIEKGDHETISEIDPLASIENPIAPASPVQPITRLRGSRRLLGGDVFDDNVTAPVSQDVIDNYADVNDTTIDEWPNGTDIYGDDNYTIDEWPNYRDIYGDDGNSTEDGSEEEEESQIQKWFKTLDPAVQIVVSVLVLGAFAAIATVIFVSLYCCCGITPCDLIVCACASVWTLILCFCDDGRRYYYY